jgi:hypothetical protein
LCREEQADYHRPGQSGHRGKVVLIRFENELDLDNWLKQNIVAEKKVGNSL